MTLIKTLAINGEYITLGQLLKDENVVSSGGQAKWYLKESSPLEWEAKDRRGKLYPGDKLEVAGSYELTKFNVPESL